MLKKVGKRTSKTTASWMMDPWGRAKKLGNESQREKKGEGKSQYLTEKKTKGVWGGTIRSRETRG